MVKDITPPAPSPRWKLNIADWQRIGKNALVFLAPGILVFLLIIQQGGTMKEAAMAGYYWGLATLIDIFRKLKAGKGPTT